MPTISTTRMTAEQFLMLGEDPPGVRLELVDGEVAVSPSPTPNHSHVVVNLLTILNNHIFTNKLGELHQDVDTLLDTFNVRRPDVLFFTNERAHLIGAKAMEGPPDLAVEVMSPSSVSIDRKDKFAQYRKAGVRFYWIIDPGTRTIEGWELKKQKYVASGRGGRNDVVQLQPFPTLEIPLKRLWRKA